MGITAKIRLHEDFSLYFTYSQPQICLSVSLSISDKDSVGSIAGFDSLFINDTILYIENPKNSTKKTVGTN